MNNFNIGDIVVRKSYGNDMYFKITNIVRNPSGEETYILKGLLYRLEADSDGSDLIKQDPKSAYNDTMRSISQARSLASSNTTRGIHPLIRRFRSKPGRVLHLDSDVSYMQTCLNHYTKANIPCIGRTIPENEQPGQIKTLLSRYSPDILVVTGHDGIKKNNADMKSMENYKTSKYFVASVKEARSFESSLDKLCIFAGACQSYYEEIMKAGANFASSPGRILINALDPALVSEKIALTDYRYSVSSEEISRITISGSKGIGGITTKGHLYM